MYKISFLSFLVILQSYITQYNEVAAVIRQKQEYTDGIMYKRGIESRKEIESEVEKVFFIFLVTLIVVSFSLSCFLSIRKKQRKARHRKAYDDIETIHSMQTTNATVTSERLQSITSSNRSFSTFRTSMNSIVGNITFSNRGSNINTPITSSLSSSSSTPTQPPIVFLIPTRVTNIRELSTRDRNSLSSPHGFYWPYQDIFEVEVPPPYKPQEN